MLKSGRIAAMTCRLYINQPLEIGTSLTLPSDQAHYLRSVMRLSAGEEVILFNGQGGEFLCSIEQLTRDDPSVQIESHADLNREMATRVHIVQAACRSEKIESILQKATELGAASFTIVRSQRSTLKLDGPKLKKRLQRWQTIVIEAAEQSGRTIVPEVCWLNALKNVSTQGLAFTLHPEPEATSWKEQNEAMLNADDITLAVGPEGGWSDQDIEALNAAGFSCLTFGPRIMRTETAAPALLAAIQSRIDS